MPLTAPNLDDRRFQQFVDDAKRYIQQRCPEWTDHNVSDPGVTLIEAVAHMVDQLVYRLNRVPEKNHVAFLELLGISLLPPSAARTDVTFWLSAPQDDDVVLPTGVEVATLRTEHEDAVVFATDRELRIVPSELAAVAVQPAGGTIADHTADVRGEEDFACFSAAPRPGDVLAFGLSAAVPSCTVMITLGSRVDGVGVDPRQPPLRWEAWTGEGWRECEVASDGTGGLNRAGEVVLHVPDGHVMSRLGVQEAGWLRCRVTEPLSGQPFYSVSPTIRSAEAATVGGTAGAVHAETILDETIGEAAGVPGERFRTEHAPVVTGDPSLVLEISDGGGWREWKAVEHFSASGPADRHFRLDAATGEISFGPAVRTPDGGFRQYGAVPDKGAV
ncbi:MAG: putative baseplate assembly protein, partial [Spirillospora sp.]